MSKYVIKKSQKDRGLYFILEGDDAAILAESGKYAASMLARAGMECLRKNAAEAGIWDRTADTPACPNPRFEIIPETRGRYTFVFRARNGREIVRGPIRRNAEEVKKDISEVKQAAAKARLAMN